MLVYVALVFGIFGLVAYVGEESLKKRITALERQLTNMQGTSFAEERRSLIEMARSYIGQQVQIKLTSNAAAGIIPVTFGLVKTDDSAYSKNIRIQSLVTVMDASVADVAVTIPKGDYASNTFKFSDIAKNIEFAFGETNLYNIAKGLDTDNDVYDVYIMNADGTLSGGPGKYTANGAGYWLDQKMNIVSWGKDDFALFIEPTIWDDEKSDYYADGGGFNIGRLSNDTPASGSVLNLSIVLKKHDAAATDKTLTINFTLTFE